MEQEWQIPDADVPIEQGDIVISRSVRTGVINEILLVITADCDISKRKFGTNLACLRIISLRDYLRNTWAERKLDRLVRNEAAKMAQSVNKWNSQRISDALPLTIDVVMNWIRDSDPTQICVDLGIPESDVAKVAKNIGAFRSAIHALESRRESDSLIRLCVFRSIMSGKCFEDCRKDVLKQAQNDALPEDVFLLPDLPQVDIGSAVILLRQLVGLRFDTICFRTTDATSDEMFLRIGRLEPTFKYAVSQAFGVLYSRIGLTESYEERCRTVFHQITDIQWE